MVAVELAGEAEKPKKRLKLKNLFSKSIRPHNPPEEDRERNNLAKRTLDKALQAMVNSPRAMTGEAAGWNPFRDDFSREAFIGEADVFAHLC